MIVEDNRPGQAEASSPAGFFGLSNFQGDMMSEVFEESTYVFGKRRITNKLPNLSFNFTGCKVGQSYTAKLANLKSLHACRVAAARWAAKKRLEVQTRIIGHRIYFQFKVIN